MRALLTLAALLGCALLAACGSSASPSGTNAASKEASQEQNAESQFQKYARCLREHGVDAQAASQGGRHGLKVSPGSSGPGGLEAAEKACSKDRPKDPSRGNEPPQVKVEHQEALERFAKCMREHNIKVEVNPSGGVGIRVKAGSGAPRPESPAFKAAQNACQKLLPGGGPPGAP